MYDLFPSDLPTLVDYFGKYINDDDNFVFGIYGGLVKFKGYYINVLLQIDKMI